MKSVVRLRENFVTEVKVGKYTATFDSPATLGGTEGMCPGEGLLSSIAGCKIMSFKMAANAKRIDFNDFKDLEVEVSAEINPDGELEGTKMAKLRVTKIHTVYKLKTTKSQSEVEELIKAVDEICVVGQALDSNIERTQEIIIL
ncbi:OsmC family protein [Clostridium cylindrosporum]|uniref:Putative peroxiredoxin, OsmC-like protein n=1 Tax=Clostridium cylindrosporum DSM 605 TaxID=1121307 RepID=A0A0J8DED2_CLOCY|nr:OsmC family protein [Clostridium cylindrosporum]KMT22553.1 putative peroxiredoxin, OsmC-like protein [Clostridium cylindrosporum DSM 605]